MAANGKTLTCNKEENFLTWRGCFNVLGFPSQGVFLLATSLFSCEQGGLGSRLQGLCKNDP